MKNTEDRDFKGIWIPKELYLNDELSWTEKILVVEINSLDKGKGCWAGNEYFAEFLGLKEGRIANIFTKLRKMKILEDVSFDGRKRFVRVTPEFTFSGRQSSLKSEGRVHEKVNEKSDKIHSDGSTQPPSQSIDEPNNTFNNTSTLAKTEVFAEGEPKEESSNIGKPTLVLQSLAEFMEESGCELKEMTNNDGEIQEFWFRNGKMLANGVKKGLEEEYAKKHHLGKHRPISLSDGQNLLNTPKIEPFSYQLKLEEMKKGNYIPDKILALYWEKKNFIIANQAQLRVKRSHDHKPAKKVEACKYTPLQFQAGMEYCQNKYEDNWTIDTVLRVMPEVLKRY
jgi:hypothetical protein